MAVKKEGMERVGLRIPAIVKDWYIKESNGLGLTMGQYMTLVLVNYQRQQENAEIIRNLSELSKNTEVQSMNKEILEILNNPDFKQLITESKKGEKT